MAESDPKQYREEWFNIVPNGKEFALPNVSNPSLDLPMTNFSLRVNPQNALPYQADHFPCNILQRRPKYRPIRKPRCNRGVLPNLSSRPNIPYGQIHGLPNILGPQTLFRGRLNTPLSLSARVNNIFPVRNQEYANHLGYMAEIKYEPAYNNIFGGGSTNASGTSWPVQIPAPNLARRADSTMADSTAALPRDVGRSFGTYAQTSALSLSSLFARQEKIENMNRELLSRVNKLAVQYELFGLIAAGPKPDLSQYHLTRPSSPFQFDNFGGYYDFEEDVRKRMRLFEVAVDNVAVAARYPKPGQQAIRPQAVHTCQECGASFVSGNALGGHVSSHARKRKRAVAKSIGREFRPGSGESFFDYVDQALGFFNNGRAANRAPYNADAPAAATAGSGEVINQPASTKND